MTCDFLCGNLCRSIFVNSAAGYIMGSEKVDPEIKEFLEVEQQKAQLQAQVLHSCLLSSATLYAFFLVLISFLLLIYTWAC